MVCLCRPNILDGVLLLSLILSGNRAPRATWIQTELFLTFPTPLVRSITLQPLNAPETGGRFRVWVDLGDSQGDQLVWDRKVRFAEKRKAV